MSEWVGDDGYWHAAAERAREQAERLSAALLKCEPDGASVFWSTSNAGPDLSWVSVSEVGIVESSRPDRYVVVVQ